MTGIKTHCEPDRIANAAKAGGDGPGSIRRAREAARNFAGSLSPAPRPDAAEALVLVVSELVTNALRHGGGRYDLRLTAGPEALAVAVTDPSPAAPRERRPDLNGFGGGFGWHMVRRLARYVEVTPGPGPGKTVHALLAR